MSLRAIAVRVDDDRGPPKVWSTASPLRDSEAVLQHLKADNFTICGREYDGEVCLDDLARSLELGGEGSKDSSSLVATQNVVDFKSDWLGHGAQAINEFNKGAPARLFADPGQSTGIARYFPFQVFAEQLRSLARFGPGAQAAQKLLREVKCIVLSHRHIYIYICSRAGGIVLMTAKMTLTGRLCGSSWVHSPTR